MKKNFSVVSLVLVAFVLGMMCNNVAYSTASVPAMRVAVVDITKVIKHSKEINLLKENQKKRTRDLIVFVEKAKNDVDKQKDPKTKKALEDKYNKELNLKRNSMEKEYKTKLEAIQNNIIASVAGVAKAKNYQLVLTKSTVLYGGTDITTEIVEKVK